jgi:hypothetical protein
LLGKALTNAPNFIWAKNEHVEQIPKLIP